MATSRARSSAVLSANTEGAELADVKDLGRCDNNFSTSRIYSETV